MFKASLLVLAIWFLLAMAEASTKKSYLISTKNHTSLEVFRSWIQKLDGSSGIQIVHEHIEHQSYVTELTPSEAEEVKRTDFIRSVHEQGEPITVRSHRAAPSSGLNDTELAPHAYSSRKSGLEERKVVDHGTLTNQKKWLSWNQEGRPPIDAQYVTDDNEGEGVDIYLIDTGFNVHLEVSFSLPGLV